MYKKKIESPISNQQQFCYTKKQLSQVIKNLDKFRLLRITLPHQQELLKLSQSEDSQ